MTGTPLSPNLDLQHLSFAPRSDRGLYEVAVVRWASGFTDHEVEVTVSPTGRSHHVYVDGVKWGPVE